MKIFARASACLIFSLLSSAAIAATAADQPQPAPTNAPQDQTPFYQPPPSATPATQKPFSAAVPRPETPLAPGETPSPVRRLSDALKALDEDGVHARAQLILEPAGNVSGGVTQGSTVAGQVQFGADLNLEKLIHDPGATFHITIFQDMGRSLAVRNVGMDYALQEIYKNAFEHVHYGVFSYEQNFFDNRLNIVLGRLGTTSYFAHVPEYCDFLNGAICGISTILKIQSGLVLPPSSTWGGRVLYKLTPDFSAAIGLSEANPTASASNGLDFSTAKSTGVGVPVELAYQRGLNETRYPFIVKVGWVYSDAPHADPYFNTKGQSLALFGGTAELKNTRNALYVSGDKTIWQNSNFPQSLIVFGNETQELEYSEIYRADAAAGIVLAGPFQGRPLDRVAFEAFDLQLTPHEVEFLRDSRIKAGGRGLNSADEYEMEATYSYAFLPGLKAMPSIQYIIHPDNSLLPKTRFVPGNAVVFGIQLIANFGSLLGVPSPLVQ